MSVLLLVYGPKAAFSPGSWGGVVVVTRLLLVTRWRLLLEDAVVVDIFAKEDLTDMGLLLSEAGNFLVVSEAGDLVSELSVKTKLNNCFRYQYLVV